MNKKEKQAGRSIWRYRGRKFIIGFNVWTAICLGMILLIMVNCLAGRYYRKWDITSRGYYRLSDKTKGMLAGLDCELDIVSFFAGTHELHDDIKYLLREYEYESRNLEKLGLNVVIVDPVRDFAAAREAAEKYGVNNANVVVFQSGGRRKYLGEDDIDDYKNSLIGKRSDKRRYLFRGEQAFSSAIQTITQIARPVVYVLSNHGERAIDDYSKGTGYSRISKVMTRDGITVKKLDLVGKNSIPDDCSALVVAGPQKELAQSELAILTNYLEHNGRVFFLLDAGFQTGLESLLAKWSVMLEMDVVVDPQYTRTGRELVVTEYGDHPITRNLMGVMTTFFMPRSVMPLPGKTSTGAVPSDKPRVVPLVLSSGKGWAEKELNQSAVFDAGIDQAGPVPVAVAVERGPLGGINVEINPTRIVVVGDSDFVSNGGLEEAGGGNECLFMSALNWLIERETLMAIAPKPPGELRMDMNARQIRIVFAVISFGGPAMLALLGIAVLLFRRR